jgi:hypothetical protein
LCAHRPPPQSPVSASRISRSLTGGDTHPCSTSTIALYLVWPNIKTLVKLSSDFNRRTSKDSGTK